MVLNLKREVEDINRFREIITILIEQGFSFLLSQMNIRHPKIFLKNIRKADNILSNPQIFVRTLERLGPTFIKFGQLLSVRPDLIPKDYIHALERLQDKVVPDPFLSVKETIQGEFKKEISELFSYFNPEPIASASISQVYEAKLKTGEKVAVKVLRKNVKEKLRKDIDIMFYIAGLMEKHIHGSRRYSPIGIVREFAKWTMQEIDLRNEARNAKRFKRNFKNSKIVYIPKVFDMYTSEKVLVEEFIEGIEMHEFFNKKRERRDILKIINYGIDATLTQVFLHGFFHADPHPGNVIILKNKSICLVDFGIVGYFNDRLKNLTLDLLYNIVRKDYDMVAEVCLEIGNTSKEDIDFDTFKNDIIDVIDPIQNKTIEEVKISAVFDRLFNIMMEYNIRLDHSFVIFGKTLMELEGVALKYDSKLKIISQVKPFLDHLITERTNPKNIAHSIINETRQLLAFAKRLPKETETALKKIKEGTIKVDINETELKRLSLEIDRSSNRVTYGVLIASFLVTGALMIDVGIPKYFNIPMFSFILFICAGIFFFILLISIINEKKLNY